MHIYGAMVYQKKKREPKEVEPPMPVHELPHSDHESRLLDF
jgi:hypothetical protein